MERLIVSKEEKRKSFIKSCIVVLGPLVVFGVIWGSFALYSAYTMRVRRAEIVSRNTEAINHDFNYLLQMLEDNLPTLGILQRKNGVDLLALGEDLRQVIYELEYDIYFMHFWRILGSEFLGPLGPASPTGNLVRIDETTRQWLNIEHQRSESDAIGFDDVFEHSPNFVINTLTVNFAEMTQVVNTDIIEAGRIALYDIQRFSGRLTPYSCIMTQTFFAEIQDYENLIIDLRGNSGGALWFFDEIVGRYLVNEEAYAYFYNFYAPGRHNMEFMNQMGSLRPESSAFDIDQIMLLFEEEYQHIRADLEQLPRHYVYRHSVTPRDDGVFFGGNVWILVDEYVTGAAQMVATFYSRAGIATLVGNTTGGGFAFCNVAGNSNFVTLPKTGIIVRYDPVLSLDSNGRPIEYGTIPHYFNRPDMDALETVLAMIQEQG